MGTKKKVNGICRLCGNEKELTKEHVPPRSTFNKHTKYFSIPLDEIMSVENPLKHTFKGKKYQGGIGYYTLCEKCNNFLGSEYVNSYRDWVLGGFLILKKGNHLIYGYDIINIEPLRVLKQIISMFLSINDDWYLDSYHELSEFVKNPTSNELPNRFQIHTYLNNEGFFRHIPHQVKYLKGSVLNCTEITYPPYGYVLTMNTNSKINKLTNITYFKDYSLGEKVNLKLEMYRLPTYSQFMLEYPPKENF